MLLKEIIIKNFRGYRGLHRISVDQLTAFVGKNDAGKSTIFDALGVFFDHPLCKWDFSDLCVHAEREGELRIGCVFENLPEALTIDTSSETSLADEYLLNAQNCLEIHKVCEYEEGKFKKVKIVAVALHPQADGCSDLLTKKNSDLKKLLEKLPDTDGVDRRSNVAMRRAIWANEPELQLGLCEVQMDKEDSKRIWEQISRYLPEFALFRADRPSTDEDAEVQDPLKLAIKEALEQVADELQAVKAKVQEHALRVADRTLEKLKDFDKELASQLSPSFKSDPKWEGIFKLSLTGDDEIPINKRGSGVRRLILFSFFRAEAERLRQEHQKKNIIYAIEEPETAQHPSNQKKVIEALRSIAANDGCQVFLTTHVPGLAGLLPVESLRYVRQDAGRGRGVCVANESVIEQIASELGVVPDKRAKVIVCVEGPHDLRFLRNILAILRQAGHEITDLFEDPRVAFVLLGGSTLVEWVNQHYLKNVGLPEVHIYDRDQQKDGKYKYQAARNAVNQRGDKSVAFLTEKREMENYLHLDAINEAIGKPLGVEFSFIFSDECDVEKEIREKLGCSRIQRRPIKSWLNEEAASSMTVKRLEDRNALTEIVGWFSEIEKRMYW